MKPKIKIEIALAGLFAASLGGCMSMQSQSVQDAVKKAQQPFVEAYIEYTGPQSRWVGPASWVLHVNARDISAPAVTVTPKFSDDELEHTDEKPRKLASADDGAKAKKTGAEFRTQLAELATTVEGQGEPVFRGCLSPVRIRMIREDGGLLERQGCRGSVGWARKVSESVSRFLASAPSP